MVALTKRRILMLLFRLWRTKKICSWLPRISTRVYHYPQLPRTCICLQLLRGPCVVYDQANWNNKSMFSNRNWNVQWTWACLHSTGTGPHESNTTVKWPVKVSTQYKGKKVGNVYLTTHSTHFVYCFYGVEHAVKDHLERKSSFRLIATHFMNEGRKEMFYLTTHSTHFIYGYMASDLW